jgi:hypothetical protein
VNDQVRRELLNVLEQLSVEAPDLRMGQLIANLSYLARGPANESIWDVDDDELLAAAVQQLETLEGRAASAERVAD